MPKKLQFLTLSLLMTTSLGLLSRLDYTIQPWVIIFFSFFSYLASAYLLRYDLAGIELLTILSLPALFTLAVGSTLYFFPNFSFVFRILILIFFGSAFYLILLSENIFNVGRQRPIPLLKAAGTVSFLLTLLTAFLLFTAIFKASLPTFSQWLLIAVLVFILGLQSLWTIFLGEKVDRALLVGSLTLALAELELTIGLSFLPFESFFRALALSTGFYVFLGTGYNYQRKTLKGRIFLEYAVVAGIVIFFLLIL